MADAANGFRSVIEDFDAGSAVDTFELPEMDQDAAEFAALLDMLDIVEPATILEIGVYMGGTLARFAERYPFAKCVAIDPMPQPSVNDVLAHFPVSFVRGHSQTERVRAAALDHAGGFFDFAFIDGDHSYPAAKADWEWCREHTRKLIALHDTRRRDTSAIEVWKLWAQLHADATLNTRELAAHDDKYGIGVVLL